MEMIIMQFNHERRISTIIFFHENDTFDTKKALLSMSIERQNHKTRQKVQNLTICNQDYGKKEHVFCL